MQPDLQDIAINSPELWRDALPRYDNVEIHKYRKGQANVLAGAAGSSGAAMLASEAALRSGAGVVRLLAAKEDIPLYAVAARQAVIKCSMAEMDMLLADSRPQAWLAGPGLGISESTRANVLRLLHAQKPTVLDADALTSFADTPRDLFNALHVNCLLTPHEGEFKRLFPDIEGDKIQRARLAAERCGATLLLKGSETIIATPEGRIIRHNDNVPQLATAGSGDVLAGICVGLLAQAIPVLLAASVAVWAHCQAGKVLGSGLIADDLVTVLPRIWQQQ